MAPPDYPFPGSSPTDPPPRLAELRASEPISRVTLASGPAWLLTRHADIRAAIADPALAGFMPGVFEGTDHEREQAAQAGFLMMMDGPPHQRLRRPLAGAMSARRIADLRPRIEARARELVAGLAGAGGGEVVRELAGPLAIDALGALIGVDVTARPDFARWSDDSAAMFGGSDPAAMAESGAKLFAFIGELVAAEGDSDGLVGDLFRLVPDDGTVLTDAEVTGLVGQLLMAGYLPTAMVTGLGVHRVLRAPDLVASLRADPDLLPGLVDELLRLDPGAAGTVDRLVRARGEVELGGRTFADGDVLVLPLGAANRDPDVFADPDRIDPSRRPNPHVSFFPGPHHCVGAALARTVLGAMIGALVEHPSVALGGEPAWITGVLGETQLTALPIHVGAPAAAR